MHMQPEEQRGCNGAIQVRSSGTDSQRRNTLSYKHDVLNLNDWERQGYRLRCSRVERTALI